MTSRTTFTLTFSLAAILLAGCGAESAETIATAGAPTAAPLKIASAPRPDPPTHNVVLPDGTVLMVRTTSALSTATQGSGQAFTAHLEESLIHGGRTMAPKGAEVRGIVANADKGGRVKDVASIGVRLTALNGPNGFVEISTDTLTQTADTTKRNDAVKIAIGSGVGAAIGAIAGGGKGAAIGAAAGGGAGTGVVLATRGDAAVIPSESVLTFTLRRPVMVVGD